MSGQPDEWRPLRIAMVGQKGLPATYGGVEHHVEQLGKRLAARGHRVTVFTRRSYGDLPEVPYLGMDVRPAATIASKHLDAIVHSATSTVLALSRGCDVVHYHALGPGLVAPLPRYASRAGVVLTVHGLDQQRGKWGGVAQRILGVAHQMSARVPNETVVVSRALAEHYRSTFGKQVSYIPNGVDRATPADPSALSAFGLEPRRYLLFVGRMVPEKAPAALVEAFRGVDTDLRLVLAGDSSFTDTYTEQLRRLAAADPRVRLLGFVHGEQLRALYQQARLFVQPSLLEGLPLTLLEAVSHAVPVLASDIPPHLEVLDRPDNGRAFFRTGDVRSLRESLTDVLAAGPPAPADLERLREATLDRYNWDRAADELERVYLRAAARATGGLRPSLAGGRNARGT